MASSLVENSETWAQIIRDSIEHEKNYKSRSSLETNLDVDVAYFGLEKDTSAGFREVISYPEFKKLVADKSRLSSAINERGFSGFAYKLISKHQGTSHNLLIKRSHPRNFIVFIDSLDLTILDDTSYQKGLKALPDIVNNSIIYKNFTASGDWTYPCLFSMHTGTLPQFNFSNFRHDPTFRFLERDQINSMNHNMATYYITRSLILPGSKLKNKDFLTRKIAEKGFKQAGIKSSRNHGWRCGLTHSIDISLENCSMRNISKHMEYLRNNTTAPDIDTYFIDIDKHHRIIHESDLANNFQVYYKKSKSKLSKEMQAAISKGMKYSAKEYLDAVDFMDRSYESYKEVFEDYHGVLSPCSTGVADKGLKSTGSADFNRVWSYMHTPAISLPLLQGENNLPLGIQLVGDRYDDNRFLGVANWLEKESKKFNE